MKSNTYFFAFLLAFAFYSCDKEFSDRNLSEDVIFGIHAPFCRDNCTNFYLYSEGKVYKQAGPEQFPDSVEFETVEVAPAKANSIIEVLQDMPENPFNEARFLGCPGCADEPYLYVKEGENVIKIDLDANSIPEKISIWASQLTEAINL